MQIWISAAVLVLILWLVVSKRRKAVRKAKVQQAVTRPPVHPAPFDVDAFKSALPDPTGQEKNTRDAIKACATYCDTYRRLLAGEDAAEIETYADILTGVDANASDVPPLEHFIRTAFHSDVLYGYLAQEMEKNLKTSIEAGMAQHWWSGSLGEAAMIAFRQTGEVRYLALYRQFFDRFMMLRDTKLGYHDDFHGKTMDSWGAYNLGKNAGKPGLWVAHVTHFTVCMFPATGFARDVLSTPTLTDYHDWATSALAYVEQAYKQFDADYRDVDGVSEKWYWRPLLDKYEATNHMHLLGQALINLYAATKNELYAERIRSFIRIFEGGVTLHDNGMASWNYSPYFQVANEKNGHISRQFSEYTWKGEITVPFLYEAKAAGFEIRPEVLQGVTSSIRDHILKDADYKLHVHPQASRPLDPRDRKKASFIECGISGFHAAAAEDARIEQQVIDVVAASPDLFPTGWMSHPRLTRSYARLLPASAGEKALKSP